MTLRTTGGVGTPLSVSDETPISPTELRALRRLAEPDAPATVEANELWASRYRIVEPIGRGGMGDVFLARDVLLDRQVALKVLRNALDEDSVDERLLLREARAAARAEHPRIARVYDAGTWNDRAFIAMEYVRGETLRAWMKTHRATPEEVVFILQQLAEGIHALHERELVHRDLKPENVMVAHDGNLRILDLGIARRVPLGLAQQPSGDWSQSIGFGVGTPGYMAPEQWQGLAVDARADVFALGVIVYELVVGSAPFRATSNPGIREKTLHSSVSFDAPEWDSMPSGLRDVTRLALSRDREQRFSSADQMLAPLAPLYRPSIPPISSARSPSFRPSAAQAFAVDSAQGSALGVSVRALPDKRRFLRSRAVWAVAGTLAVSAVIGGALRAQSNAGRSAMPPTRGMIRLQGGTFSMGSDAEDLDVFCKTLPKGCPPEAQNEVPKHTATVAPFEIDEHEVTNEDFARFLNATAPSLRVTQDPDDHYDRFVRYSLSSNEGLLLYDLWPGVAGIRYDAAERAGFLVRPEFEKLPVIQVTWLGARLFCKNAGKRLPTEAEWEFTASGSERRPFPWGTQPPDCDGVHIASKQWLSVLHPDHCDDAREIPFAVMSAAQDVTPEGVRDLGGNVAEWVDVDQSVNDDEAAYAKRLSRESSATFRGSAFDTSFMARSSARNFRLGFNVAYNLGFRCAKAINH